MTGRRLEGAERAADERTWLDRGVAVLIVAGMIAAALLVSLAARPPQGEREKRGGSTHAAAPEGASALYEYLERAGFSPSRAESVDLAVPAGGALVILDAELTDSEVEDVLARVREGLPVLVATGSPYSPWWQALDLEVDGSGTPGRVGTAWPGPHVRDVTRVDVESSLRAILGENDATTGLMTGAGWVELLADDAGAVAVARRIGAGEVTIVLDPSIFSNAGLPKGHNLRFADSVLRHLSTSGAVVFDEFHHGHGFERTITGWMARAGLLPAAWLAFLAVAGDALRRNRTRLGPPRPPPEPERRAVREFVASYAGLLLAAGHRAFAVRALDRQLRRRLQDDLAIPFHAAPKDVFRLLTIRAPQAAARAYRALERARELRAEGTPVSDRELLDIARDVRSAESSLIASRRRRSR